MWLWCVYYDCRNNVFITLCGCCMCSIIAEIMCICGCDMCNIIAEAMCLCGSDACTIIAEIMCLSLYVAVICVV